MPERAFAQIGDRLTTALLAGDFAIYRSLMLLPLVISPRGGLRYVLETEPALFEDFTLYHANIRAHSVTDIFRQPKGLLLPSPGRAELLCLTHIMVKAHRIVDPFETVFHLEDTAEGWRIREIESSEGHINWTLGRAAISPGGTFTPRLH